LLAQLLQVAWVLLKVCLLDKTYVAGNTTLGDDRTADTHTISGSTTVDVPDNTAVAFQIKENTQTYITAVTTNTSESVTIEATPKLLVKNTTDNTLGTAASGSAQFTGGVGIAKNLTVGDNLTVISNLDVDGDANIDGGDLTTSATTFNILNSTATTVNFAGAATTIAMGAATGTLTIGNQTITGTNAATFNMNGTNPSIVSSNTGTASVFNTNILTGNLFGVSTTVNIGTSAAALSTITIGPAITGNIFKIGSTAAGTINLTTDVTSGTVNAWQSVTGTVNIANSGTINLGNSTTATTGAVVGGAFTGNSLKIAGTAAGAVTLNSDVTTGSVNLFNNITTGTLNVAGAGASTINLGSATSTVNIGVLTLTTDLAVQYGGTGQSSFTTNGVIYGQNASGLAVTAASVPGSNATTSYGILTTDVSNVPVWTDTIDGGSY
jgi:hypothetical protein